VAMLADRRDDFQIALTRTSRRQEWGVKAYAAGPAEAKPAPGDGGAEDAAAGGKGAAYLRRRRDELSAQQDARRELTARVEQVHAALCQLAADSRLHPPQAPQLTGTTAQMLLNAAYLLDEQRSDDFAAAVDALAANHPVLRLDLTGPWPPYSFASVEPGEGAW
jgi:Gas vesicle synthesis protein GvpL/GvpF